MKRLTILFFLAIILHAANGQVKIHAHNDYEKPVPLYAALEAAAYSIEVDIFLVKGELLVAHSLKETNKKKTLQSLYLNPIISLFKKHKGSVSADSSYKPSLVIDIKQNCPDVLKELVRIFKPLGAYFDRSVNPHAVQLIISGDRGPSAEWNNYPSYIYFDGRPFEEYSPAEIKKIAMVSDNYYKYLAQRTNLGDSIKIRTVVNKAHEWNKPFRFWASPDTEAAWKLLYRNGADIINTDKPVECREYFEKVYRF